MLQRFFIALGLIPIAIVIIYTNLFIGKYYTVLYIK